MCDTLVALGQATADGAVVFAKNSDREPDEAQILEIIPGATHPPGASVRCTYLEIPQVERTYTVLLSRPFWMWGAEMGANEHGVVIGNEAVFTRIPYEKQSGLTGMDLLRLALERAQTAEEALWVIVRLLEAYGQGGNCGFRHPFYYHNSFLIADPREAWVLETAGRHWVAERVRDVRTISNALSIHKTWDLASEDVVRYALDQGWCKRREDFDFAACYSDWLFTRFGDGRRRQVCSLDALRRARGRIEVLTLMTALRTHNVPRGNPWRPDRGLVGADICMHAAFGPVRRSQSVASLIAHLKPGHFTFWATGTSAPCTSIFKPFWLDSGLPDMGPYPRGEYDPESLFWSHEVLHREILRDYPTRIEAIRGEREALEARFLAEAERLVEASLEERYQFSQRCLEQSRATEQRWLDAIRRLPIRDRAAWLYMAYWQSLNRLDRMPSEIM
ncbi:C69 family dipeptidase [uncultured Thermanaerothrix sp.]|uniref:C69 family dipeptidase n=1 Tax=uncultured Thermanaerothrix sp. TaxID=1195149 RepID=UPI002625854E|nr:C69 family dipeptidase [uncultured Thermanaerothrix sp.]